MGIDQVRRQSLISLASTVGLTAAGFVATMYFSHALGKTAYGAYAIFLAYYGVFNLIGDGGFGGAAVKRISEERERDEYFTAFLVLRVLLLAVSVTALLAVRPFIDDLQGEGILFWLVLALVIGVFTGVTGNGVYGEGKVGVNQSGGLLNNLVKILLQIVAVFSGMAPPDLPAVSSPVSSPEVFSTSDSSLSDRHGSPGAISKTSAVSHSGSSSHQAA